MANEALRNNVAKNEFVNYHTSYSSAAQLIVKMIETIPQMRTTVFRPQTLDLINASHRNPWDSEANSKIPISAIMVTYVFLDVNDCLPSSWYQGKKAYDTVGISSGQRWRQIFKRIKEISKDVSALEPLTTVQDAL